MWEYLTSISYDSSKMDQYLRCHKIAVRDRNEVITIQLITDGICEDLAATREHRALEVSECAHHFLKEYFHHLAGLRDRGFTREVITDVARAIAGLMARVVRLTPEQHDRSAPVLAGLRLCRMFELLMSQRFETPGILRILGPKLAISNTNLLTALDSRLRSLEGGDNDEEPGQKKARALVDYTLTKTIDAMVASGKTATAEEKAAIKQGLYEQQNLKQPRKKGRARRAGKKAPA